MTAHHRIQLGLGGHLGQVAAELIQGWRFGGTLRATAAATTGDFSGFTQHADDLGSDFGQINAQVLEHAGGHTFTFPDQSQQQMLGADVVVPQLTSLLQREFKHTLGSWGEGDFDRHKAGSTADDLLHFNPGILEVDAHGLQNLGGDASAFSDQTQKNLLRANEVVTEPASLFLGQHDHLDGLLSKTFEHREADT